MSALTIFNRRSPTTFRRDNSLFPEFDNLVNSIFDTPFIGFPAISGQRSAFRIDVSETEKGYEIAAELPGVAKNEITIDLNDEGVLTIAVRKDESKDESSGNYVHRERVTVSSARSIRLPMANKKGVKAKLDAGVLTVTVEKKAAEEKSVGIEIE